MTMKPYSSLKLKLNNGTEMPAIGLGTFRIRDERDIMKAVDCALESGYRLFDTAAVYGNEHLLRKAFKLFLPKYGLNREDIFITTKLSPSHHGDKKIIEKACLNSLENLGLDYVDLYLIHFPGTAKLASEDIRNKEIREKTWECLIELYNTGKAKAIGVSNFTVQHLVQLIDKTKFVPTVNQVEWHPYYYQQELLDFCKEKHIVLQAYSSLGGKSSMDVSLVNDPVVLKIAKKCKVTPSQLLLAWALQQGVTVIPKSTNPEHIRQNISLNFVISEEDIKALNTLQKRTKYAWDPSVVA